MNLDELKRISGRKKIPQGVIYKDYVITVILEKISKLSYYDSLVFKGGTCIKKIYFQETRFSVDIDFTCINGKVSEMIQNDLKDDLEKKVVKDITFDEIVENGLWEDSVSYKVKYKDLNDHPNSVKVDLSLRESPVLEPEKRDILNPDYTHISDFHLFVFSLKEILAEKIRAVFTREAARDVFDVWFLLKKGVEIDLDLVDKKMSIYENIEFEKDRFIDGIEAKRDDWKRDLRTLLPESPSFDNVKKEIRYALDDI